MKVTLGLRLFAAAMLAMLVLAAVAIGLVRWRLFSAPDGGGHVDERADALAESLVVRHARAGGWSFLPDAPAARKAWLAQELERTRAVGSDGAPLPLLAHRVGLLDRDGTWLAGVVAHPLLVAFASIDTVRRPIARDGRAIGYLVIATPQGADEALAIAFLLDQQRNLAAIGFAAAGLGALAAALFAAHVRRPILRLVEATRQLGRGHLDTRVALGRSDELGELARSFDRLAAQLAETDRSRRQWVADTSHELRTPLAVLQGQLEALRDGVREPGVASATLMLRHVRALARLVDTLYQLARADVGQMDFHLQACDAWSIARDSMHAHAERISGAGLGADVLDDTPDRTLVAADAERLHLVFGNLFENAVRYTDRGGRIELSARAADGELCIAIDDTAPGVPAALVARLGERFFRAEPSRSRRSGGTGLGLALSRSIVEAHGGRLEITASRLGGLRVAVVLPLVA
ncbi:ATP-binding protein [Dokdonella sp.]|uniref:ATP-binding protein n=1 Tax=Dokdonella sp. TaxID=2291710 RepID=UPI002F3F57C4